MSKQHEKERRLAEVLHERNEQDQRLAEALRAGAESDLWYDAEEYGDEERLAEIAHIQETMGEAASRLVELSSENVGMSKQLFGFAQQPPSSDRFLLGLLLGAGFVMAIFILS